MQTVAISLFTFEELVPKAQQKVVEREQYIRDSAPLTWH
jgi:hypothetical protein